MLFRSKFWVQGAPSGERWEIYTVLEDSQAFWGADEGQGWQAVEAALDNATVPASTVPASGQPSQCCEVEGNRLG